MQFHVIPDLGSGSHTLPAGNWVAAGIACSSDLDCCTINGRRLGPQAIVPCNSGSEVRALRGVRTQEAGGALDSGAEFQGEGFATPRAGSNLVLQLYECGDVMIPPGPRAPVFVMSTGIAVTGAEGGGAWRLGVRLPMSGRSQAVVTVQRDSGDGDATILLRGIRYRTAELLAKTDGAKVSIIDETTETLWDGAVAEPTSEAEGAELTGRTLYVGGSGDFGEGFDELEVWLQVEATGTFTVEGEASGERNR